MKANFNSAPVVDEPVLVTYGQCECLGYLDAEGKWRNWYSDKELQNVSEWIDLRQN